MENVEVLGAGHQQVAVAEPQVEVAAAGVELGGDVLALGLGGHRLERSPRPAFTTRTAGIVVAGGVVRTGDDHLPQRALADDILLIGHPMVLDGNRRGRLRLGPGKRRLLAGAGRPVGDHARLGSPSADQLVRRQLVERLAVGQVARLEQVPAEGRGEGLAGGVEAGRVGRARVGPEPEHDDLVLVPGRRQPGAQRREQRAQRLVRDALRPGEVVVGLAVACVLVARLEQEQARALVEGGGDVELLVRRAGGLDDEVRRVVLRPRAGRRDGAGQAAGRRGRVRLVGLGRLDDGRAGGRQARDAGQQPEQARGDGHEHASRPAAPGSRDGGPAGGREVVRAVHRTNLLGNPGVPIAARGRPVRTVIDGAVDEAAVPPGGVRADHQRGLPAWTRAGARRQRSPRPVAPPPSSLGQWMRL